MRGEGFVLSDWATHYQRLLNYITPDVVNQWDIKSCCSSGGPEWLHAWNEGYAKLAEELNMTTRKNCNSFVSFRRSKMTKETIKLFQKCTLNQAGCQTPSKSFWIRLRVWNCQSLSVKFHCWNLGDILTASWTISKCSDFTALDNHWNWCRLEPQTVFEQIPVELVEQGVVLFTDFHSALEETQNS